MNSRWEQLQKRAKERDNEEQNYGDNAVFRHKQLPDTDHGGKKNSAKIRLLMDADEENVEVYFVAKQTFYLPFQGIKGQLKADEVKVAVPCMKTWGKQKYCPIASKVADWYNAKDRGDHLAAEMVKTYRRNYDYIMQGFVREHGLDETPPDNPIRRFVFGKQIFGLIDTQAKRATSNLFDYNNGRCFNIVKRRDGEYPKYDTSFWDMDPSPLTDEERAGLETHSPWKLSQFLPEQPDAETIKVIQEMLVASVNQEPYDPDRFAKYYRPYGFNENDAAGDTHQVATPGPKMEVAGGGATDPMAALAAMKQSAAGNAAPQTTPPVAAAAPAAEATPTPSPTPTPEAAATAAAAGGGNPSVDDLLKGLLASKS